MYPLVSAIEHFFESAEFTFHYASCKLCFNELNKKRYVKTSFFFHMNLFKLIVAKYVLYSIQESICSTYAQSLAKDSAQIFMVLPANI